MGDAFGFDEAACPPVECALGQFVGDGLIADGSVRDEHVALESVGLRGDLAARLGNADLGRAVGAFGLTVHRFLRFGVPAAGRHGINLVYGGLTEVELAQILVEGEHHRRSVRPMLLTVEGVALDVQQIAEHCGPLA